jgi:uncharacterized protein YfaS (alpha-2-macroglobulin family)
VGEEFWVRLRLRTTNRDRVNQIAVVDLLPGGVEPTLDRQLGPGSNWAPMAVCRHGATTASCSTGTPPEGGGNLRLQSESHVDQKRRRRSSAPPAFAEGMYNRQITGMSQAANWRS